MTLRDFIESKENLCINCKTKDEYEKTKTEVEKLGCKLDNYFCLDFSMGHLILKAFEEHGTNVCYSKRFGFCGKRFYEENNYKILNFEDIDWRNET